MELRNYETMFVLTPVLSEEQLQETIDKFRGFLQGKKADILHEDKIGLKKLAYPIQRKSTGVYHRFEFKAPPDVISALETEYRREEKIIRFLTFALEKHGVEYNEKKRSGVWDKKNEPKKKEAA
ncbi:MAG TPA: 30S ribosomal protein S6 [Amoebophilaceae bacterium]|nr:30S ribosomal protein S6 [Amoebophilaceae bacterium]